MKCCPKGFNKTCMFNNFTTVQYKVIVIVIILIFLTLKEILAGNLSCPYLIYLINWQLWVCVGSEDTDGIFPQCETEELGSNRQSSRLWDNLLLLLSHCHRSMFILCLPSYITHNIHNTPRTEWNCKLQQSKHIYFMNIAQLSSTTQVKDGNEALLTFKQCNCRRSLLQ